MKELGRVLRDRREQLGISLDELQTKTKIRKRYLMALEDGDWALLPGDVYARGFVRSYAEAVELDGKELLDKYIGTSHTAEAPSDEPTPKETDVRPEPKKVSATSKSLPIAPPPMPVRTRVKNRGTNVKSGGPGTKRSRNVAGETVAVIAILAVLGGAWWLIGGSGKSGHTSTDNSLAATNSTQNAQGTENAGNATGSGLANSTAPGAGNTNVSNADASAGTPSVKVISQSFTGYEQTYIVATTDPLSVELDTTDACWVQALTDGNMVDPNDTIAANDKRSWNANQSVRIKVGNVQAVSITVNGQPLTLPVTKKPIWVTITKGQSQ